MAVNWLKTGEDSAKVAEQEKVAAEKRREEQGKAFRFFLKNPKEEAKLVFVDGQLTKHGLLMPPRFYEHFINFGNQWQNFVCPQQTNPNSGDKCPICDGKDRPYLASLFTVVDLRPYTTKNNVVIPFQRRLFVAKPQTFELLNKMAATLGKGGLRGQVFSVSRATEKSPSVGDVFIPIDYLQEQAAKAQFTRTFQTKAGETKTVCDFEVLDYSKEIPYRSGDELRKLGMGAPSSGSFQPQNTQQEVPQQAAAEDFKNEL